MSRLPPQQDSNVAGVATPRSPIRRDQWCVGEGGNLLRDLAELAESVRPEPWMADAACLGLDANLWFPTSGRPADSPRAESALGICRRCPVASDCLSFAMARPELHGIWGATTDLERKRARAEHEGRR